MKYANLPERVDKGSTGGHYVVVVGYDDATQRIFINDPDYFPGTSGGFQKAYSYQTWLSAWGGFAAGENANFSLIYPTKVGLIGGGGTATPTSHATGRSGGGRGVCHRARRFVAALATQRGCRCGGRWVFGQRLTALGAESAVDGTSRSWQQVKTDAGVVALCGSILCRRSLALPRMKPADPYIVQVIDAQQIGDGRAGLSGDARDIAQPDRSGAGQRAADRVPAHRRSEWHAVAVGEVVPQPIWLGA